MTRITTLTLSHFRSHQLGRLAFDGRPVAFFGANGAGKTNLIEAISLLSPGRGLRGAAAEELIRQPESIGWKISATFAGREVETWAAPARPREIRIDGKAARQVDLARLGAVLWLVPTMDRLWVEGAEGRRRFLDRMVMSFVPDHATAVLDYERAMRDRNRLLKDQIRDPHWYQALEAQMARAAVQIDAARQQVITRLTAAQAASDSLFPAAALALTHPDMALPQNEDDLARAFADSRPRDLQAGRALVGPHRADMQARWLAKDRDAASCSTGEQKALLISLILANARALGAEREGAPILLLDEVAAHLDQNRRAALYDAICAMGVQAFMTGTGAELFTELGPRAQHVEVVEVAGQSQFSEKD